MPESSYPKALQKAGIRKSLQLDARMRKHPSWRYKTGAILFSAVKCWQVKMNAGTHSLRF
jgi:hypothetical protein